MIKFATHPVQHFLMFLVGWISESFQEIIVSGDTPTVFGRTLKLADHADRIGNPRFGRQHFLHNDRMLPTVECQL